MCLDFLFVYRFFILRVSLVPRSSECFIGKSEVLHLGGEFIYVRYFDPGFKY